MVHFQRLTPMLQVADMRRAVDWYVSVLGFRSTVDEDGWARVERDGVAIMFMRNDHVGSPHATINHYFYVDDVEALWRGIEARVNPEWGPEEMPYGMLEFAIRDPDGYLLSFGQAIKR
jgi:catechol 2,3-dioxygenase-like lactoylglutathione lyase family enzyme